MCNRRAFAGHWNSGHATKFAGRYGHPRKKFWKEKMKSMMSRPPANVLERDDKFELYVYAPGLEKSDFVISIVDTILSISVDKINEENSDWKRQEYAPGGFKRQFELSEKADKSAIKAMYENGVLIVSIPKLEGFETERQEIEIV